MFDRTIAILGEYVDCDPSEITAESALVDDLGLSSLEVINIVASASVHWKSSISLLTSRMNSM